MINVHVNDPVTEIICSYDLSLLATKNAFIGTQLHRASTRYRISVVSVDAIVLLSFFFRLFLFLFDICSSDLFAILRIFPNAVASAI